MVISLIDDQPEYSLDDAEQKERVKGEAYFLRGLCYFFLANLYAQPYNPATAAKLKNVVAKVGYDAVSVSSEPYEKKGILGRFS